MTTRWSGLNCVVCFTPADTFDRVSSLRASECGRCGALYSDELLDTADRDEWKKIENRDGFEVELGRRDPIVRRT